MDTAERLNIYMQLKFKHEIIIMYIREVITLSLLKLRNAKLSSCDILIVKLHFKLVALSFCKSWKLKVFGFVAPKLTFN